MTWILLSATWVPTVLDNPLTVVPNAEISDELSSAFVSTVSIASLNSSRDVFNSPFVLAELDI